MHSQKRYQRPENALTRCQRLHSPGAKTALTRCQKVKNKHSLAQMPPEMMGVVCFMPSQVWWLYGPSASSCCGSSVVPREVLQPHVQPAEPGSPLLDGRDVLLGLQSNWAATSACLRRSSPTILHTRPI